MILYCSGPVGFGIVFWIMFFFLFIKYMRQAFRTVHREKELKQIEEDYYAKLEIQHRKEQEEYLAQKAEREEFERIRKESEETIARCHQLIDDFWRVDAEIEKAQSS